MDDAKFDPTSLIFHDGNETQYVLPVSNGKTEQKRLTSQAQHLSNIMNGNIGHAPIDPRQTHRILDVGCGTGVVTDYLARKFPSAAVYGLDITPNSAELDSLPANLKFLHGNFLTELPSAWRISGSDENCKDLRDGVQFDYLFSRLLALALTDWDKYIRDAYSMLRPGGYLEVQDPDMRVCEHGKPITKDWRWFQHFDAAFAVKGFDTACGYNARSRFEAAGFVDVQVQRYTWPLGSHRNDSPELQAFGAYNLATVPGLLARLIEMNVTDVSQSENEQLQKDLHRTLVPQEGREWYFYVTVGRKPM